MNVIRAFLLISLCVSCAWARKHVSSSSASPLSSSSSQTLLERMLSETAQRFPGARLGVAIRSTRNDSLMLDNLSDQWFTPASTLKMVVTAAALDTMPLDWTPRTGLRLEGVKSGRTMVGVLRVVGGGDPNISSRYFPDPLAIPLAMVDSLRAQGIDTLRGLLATDTSLFPGPSRPVGWRPWFFESWYGAEVSALSFNDNVYLLKVTPGAKPGDSPQVSIRPDIGYIQVLSQVVTRKGRRSDVSHTLDSLGNVVTIGGYMAAGSAPVSWVLPVRNPARYYLTALQRAMEKRGFVYIPDSTVQPAPLLWTYTYATAPLQSILDEVNQRSQNLHAETLLRDLGAFRMQDGSSDGGRLAEKLFLRKMGIPPEDFVLVDGCGLSPDNRLKPASMCLLLSKMVRHQRGKLFVSSLGLPGVTGSGARRLSGLDLAEEVRIKTGYIAGVQGLVGYIGLGRGDTLAVTLYLNDYKGDDNLARNLMDTLWAWTARQYNGEFAAIREARNLWYEGDSIKGFLPRLDFFSKRLEGRPYFLGPTGEGAGAPIDPSPRMDYSRFDCVTFIEHAMALAAAPSPDSVFDVLQRIRYMGGQIDFSKRKHYFVEDWIGQSPDWVALMRTPGDTVIVREMDKKAFFAAKNLTWDVPNPQTSIPYLPYDKALRFAERWDGPDTLFGIGFLANSPKICVTHTGFVVARHGQPLIFRQASQLQKQTLEQPLSEYLQSRKGKTPGVLFFGFVRK